MAEEMVLLQLNASDAKSVLQLPKQVGVGLVARAGKV